MVKTKAAGRVYLLLRSERVKINSTAHYLRAWRVESPEFHHSGTSYHLSHFALTHSDVRGEYYHGEVFETLEQLSERMAWLIEKLKLTIK